MVFTFQLILMAHRYHSNGSIHICQHGDQTFVQQLQGFVPCITSARISSTEACFYWIRDISMQKWVTTNNHYHKCNTLLLTIGGIELNPGPKATKFPCGVCDKACRWNQKAVACDNCDQWYHADCMGISNSMYESLSNTSVSWICSKCEIPNHSTILYESTMSVSNSFSCLSGTSNLNITSCSEQSFGNPTSTSSPKRTSVNKENDKIRILEINFQSIKNKTSDLHIAIEQSRPDVIIGTETWLTKDMSSSEYIPGEFEVFRRDREDDPHGGVLVATRRTMVSSVALVGKSSVFLSVKVKLNHGKSVIIAVAYRPPNRTDDDYTEALIKDISSARDQNKSSYFLLGGDFNLPGIDWGSGRVTGRQVPKRVNEAFLNMQSDLALEQMVHFSTRGNNTLDLLFTSHPTIVDKCKALPAIGRGDHGTVLIDLTLAIFNQQINPRKILLWDRADKTIVTEHINNMSERISKTTYTSVDTLWEDFKGSICNIINEYIPSKLSRRRYSNPWINTKVKRVIRRRQKAFFKARRTNNTKDWARYRHLKTMAQREGRKAHDTYVDETICGEITTNPKRFWSYLKSKRQDAQGVSPLRKADGLLYSDTESKAEILNEQFHSVYTREDTTTMPEKGPSPYPEMPNIHVSNAGVLKLLKNVNSHKATGPDGIQTRLLREYAEQISPVLTRVFQMSLDSGSIPDDWRSASIVPIFKKGDKHKASNYRPVSLTSISCKLLEHIIHSQVMDNFDEHLILSDQQHGFRSKRSCETQLAVTIDSIAQSLAEGTLVDIILLDFSKAFDKVPHERLLRKLGYYGVRGPTLQWIRDFLTNRQQQVLLDGHHSSTAEVLSGVPQGTVLGPLLFLTFINDLPEVTQSEARLFADDCLLYRPIKTTEDTKILQQDLSALEKWEKEWQMAFHPEKCVAIQVTTKRSTISADYTLHNHHLEVVDSSKYLGVTINNNLKWDEHINNISARANRTLGFLRRNLRGCRTAARSRAYEALVRPTLEYAASIWDPHNIGQINQLEKVQRRAARFTTRNYTDRQPGSVTQMVKNLNWEPLQVRRIKIRLVLLFKIQHNLVAIPADAYLIPSDSRTRGENTFRVPTTRKDVYRHSFFPSTIRDWNALPAAATTASSLEAFKGVLGDIPSAQFIAQ